MTVTQIRIIITPSVTSGVRNHAMEDHQRLVLRNALRADELEIPLSQRGDQVGFHNQRSP
nr:MAG TPA: hypothetical protein [Caudoviricetes sp.]